MNSEERKSKKTGVILGCAAVLLLAVTTIVFFVERSTLLDSALEVSAEVDSYIDGTKTGENSLSLGIDEVNSYVSDGDSTELSYEEENYDTTIEVVNTVALQGVSQDITIWLGDSVEPGDMLESVDAATDVTVAWEEAPDLEKEGEQSVTILLTDADGNTQKLTATLTVIADREPPEISGAANQEIILGDSVSYRSGVTVSDNRDDQVELKIDNSKVNLNVVGEYPVTYTAADQAGNQAAVTVTFTVRDITQEEVIQLADERLAQITTPEMSNKEKCRAIYDWARKNINYVGTSNKSDIYRGAYEGFAKLRGDCYTYYAVATVMFDRLGIPNMRVDRVGGATHHYWCLVDVGEGWYHFDCSPRRSGYYIDTCLVPDSVLEEYSRDQIEGYYDFDHSLYPERGQ